MSATEQLTLLYFVAISIPSVLGLAFIFWAYEFRSKRANPRGSWLLRMLTWSSAGVTAVLVYLAAVAINRLLGNEPFPSAFLFSATTLLASIVPYKAIRLFMAMIEDDQPTVPHTSNGNGNDRPH